jgi:xylan 1,4-beta-xylosidase
VGAGLLLAPGAVVGADAATGSGAIAVRPRWDAPASTLRHSWAGMANIDQARWILRSDMQQQLAMSAREIGLKHLRFGNIFEEQLWVYDVDPARYQIPSQRNVKRVNWRNPFLICDILTELNISPIVGTYYMPKAFASGTNTCYAVQTNITPPKDMAAWGRFIRDFVKGIVDRYGIQTVRNWYFEVWNEPNLTSFYSSIQDYWPLYATAYNAIKSVDTALKVGGPSTAHSAYLTDMLEFGNRNGCVPDFLIGHIYNNDSAGGDPLSPFQGPQLDKENKSPNYISGVARGVRKLLDQASFKGEYHMNEWGLSWYPHRAERETPNEGAYIVKTMKEVSNMCDYFAYWDLSDIYVEVGYGREAFHGNYGMISLDGLRKPSYFAHQLLCKLGTNRIALQNDGDNQVGALVTRDGDTVKAIVYSFDIGYQVSDTPETRKVEFQLPPEIRPANAKAIRVDSKNNNILKTWADMGKPAHPDKAQLAFLREQNELKTSAAIPVTRDSNGTHLMFDMESPGFVYLEIA